jgi:hypothetical protein
MAITAADKQNAMALACRYIRQVHADVVGVAYVELNCDCVKMAGVSADGKLLAPLTLALAKTARRKSRPPLCRRCRRDGGVNLKRRVRHGMIWTAAPPAAPDDEIRQALGRKIFGPAYPEGVEERAGCAGDGG